MEITYEATPLSAAKVSRTGSRWNKIFDSCPIGSSFVLTDEKIIANAKASMRNYNKANNMRKIAFEPVIENEKQVGVRFGAIPGPGAVATPPDGAEPASSPPAVSSDPFS